MLLRSKGIATETQKHSKKKCFILCIQCLSGNKNSRSELKTKFFLYVFEANFF